jgi:hypothetical protein
MPEDETGMGAVPGSEHVDRSIANTTDSTATSKRSSPATPGAKFGRVQDSIERRAAC